MSRARPTAALGLLLAACGPTAAPPPPPGPVHVDLSAAARSVLAGEDAALTVEVGLAPGWSLELGSPAAEGFTVEPTGEEGPTNDRGRATRSLRYRLSGGPGSAVVRLPPATATGPAGEQLPVEVPPLFIDLGVTGPSGGLSEELALAPPPAGPPWALIGGAGAALALVVGGLLLARRRPAPPPVPLSPEQEARRAWAAARAAGLDDHALAFALSDALRRFLEQISGWPATAATPREINAWIAEVGLLDAALRPRAARVLDATDRLKFARDGGGAGFFDPLEEDLFAVIAAASRPAPLPPAPAPAAPPPPAPSSAASLRRPATTTGVPTAGAPGAPPEDPADRDPPTDGSPPWGAP
ncbi:MAG: hypothetical protein JNM72_16415 [Deltaproteobacteria bacterium]|nr:hypothetical protein [Deltaproteobacteria bacterium]